MSDIADFYRYTKTAKVYEDTIKDATEVLAMVYPKLVEVCPHPEAVEYSYGHEGVGPHRICTVCGVIDRESYGSTPGDEYDYGYAGKPDPEFWKDTEVTVTTDYEAFVKYRKNHDFEVKDGKIYSLTLELKKKKATK